MGEAILGPILGGLVGAGGSVAAGALGQNGNRVAPPSIDPSQSVYGGYTPGEQAANGADAQSAFLNAVQGAGNQALQGSSMLNRGGQGVMQLGQTPGAAAADAAAAQARAAAGPSFTQSESQRYLDQANAAQGRQGVNMDTSNIDAARAQSEAARGQVGGAVDLYNQAAHGNGPSAAQAQLQLGNDRAIAMQRSLAASAKAPGVQRAELQSQALANAGNLGAQNSAQAAALRAQEMQQGMAGYLQGSMGLRQGDATQQGLSLDQATQQARLADAQKARNDAQQQYYESQRRGVNEFQVNANLERGKANQQAVQGANQLNNANAQANAAATARAVEGGAGAVGAGISAGLQAGAKSPTDDSGDNNASSGDTGAAPTPEVPAGGASAQSYNPAKKLY